MCTVGFFSQISERMAIRPEEHRADFSEELESGRRENADQETLRRVR